MNSSSTDACTSLSTSLMTSQLVLEYSFYQSNDLSYSRQKPGKFERRKRTDDAIDADGEAKPCELCSLL
jgi:hypothetical protein